MKKVFLLITVLIQSACAIGQSSIGTTPDLQIPIFQPKPQTGGAPISASSSAITGLQEFDFPVAASLRAMNSLEPDKGVSTRSVKDAALFKTVSPSVVLIVTDKGIGSGTLVGDKGLILTNWHVVEGKKDVGVIFKPESDTQKISEKDVKVAKVIKIDQLADLALVQASEIPAGRKPLKLGDISEIAIGTDVHAIGHPRGESWTYTKGVVSQYRNDYKWDVGDNINHTADVIQTQTPINPGNSGGPLISEGGTLIGVNSFVDPKSQGINFAVSIDDVNKFISRQGNRLAPATKPATAKKKCEGETLYEGKSDDGKADMVVFDSTCSGKADMEILLPLDKGKPQMLRYDRNGDGKPDVVVFSYSRNYKWEISLWDDDYDGKWDLVGHHRNGELEPYKFEPYREYQAKAAKSGKN